MIGSDLFEHQWTRKFAFRDGAAPRDIKAHLVSRAALMQHLIVDTRVTDLCCTFDGGRIADVACLIGELGDVFARECGWRDRGHMYSEPELHDDAVRQTPHRDDYLAQLAAFPWPTVKADFPPLAAHFVHDTWGLRRAHAREQWGWLCDDLLELFVLSLWSAIEGRQFLIHYANCGSAAATPTIEVHFTKSPNESLDEARRRLKQVTQEADAALRAGRERPRGTIVDEERLWRDVEWFYRRVLKKPSDSERAVAKAYHHAVPADGTSSDHSLTIRAGVARARRLLSEIPA